MRRRRHLFEDLFEAEDKEAVLKVLVDSGITVSDTDPQGNSVLHWCLKASKVPSPDQLRIVKLLLKNGARVRQKDKLGLTAVHIAAANGNFDALKILLAQDPDCVHVTSELKETPLFFAAKNDFIECAQLLLSCGANTDVHNLRRQRPIDVAISQDMRSALNRTSVVITNRAAQQKYTACIHNDQVVSEHWETLFKEACSSESVDSSVDGDVCKYFGSGTGCARGSSCFYRHGEEELCSTKSKVKAVHSTVLAEFKQKIFVGGLPPGLDSDSLAVVIEDQFGPVADAKVLNMEINEQVVSRGFGFVTFKHEKSVAAALKAHYTYIRGKKVEMKTAVPKWLASQEDREDEPEQESVQKKSIQYDCEARNQSEKSSEEGSAAKQSWAERVGQSLPNDSMNELHNQKLRSAGQAMPKWFITFKKWLPQFLKKMAKNADEYYSLSSLKSDFKSIFGLELDHVSLGYSKLSDFIKSYPELCRVKIVHTGGQVANHMILLPNVSRPPPLVVPRRSISVSRPITPVSHDDDDDDDDVSEGTCLTVRGSEIDTHSDQSSDIKLEATAVKEVYAKTENRNLSITTPPIEMFLQFLKPDPIFLARTWLQTGGYKVPDEQCRRKHLILEALARKRKELLFLRGPNFYEDYAACLKKGNCFACGKNTMLWANYPCQHLLWCGDCKLVAMRIAAVGTSTHKCVVCDAFVEKVDLIPWTTRQHHQNNNMEFPSIYSISQRRQIFRV